MSITLNKAVDVLRSEQKGRSVIVRESEVGGDQGGCDLGQLDRFANVGPTPELATMLAEECQARLRQLPDDSFRSVALRKMEGDTDKEVATKLGIARSTVALKLQVIRKIWSDEE